MKKFLVGADALCVFSAWTLIYSLTVFEVLYVRERLTFVPWVMQRKFFAHSTSTFDVVNEIFVLIVIFCF